MELRDWKALALVTTALYPLSVGRSPSWPVPTVSLGVGVGELVSAPNMPADWVLRPLQALLFPHLGFSSSQPTPGGRFFFSTSPR